MWPHSSHASGGGTGSPANNKKGCCSTQLRPGPSSMTNCPNDLYRAPPKFEGWTRAPPKHLGDGLDLSHACKLETCRGVED